MTATVLIVLYAVFVWWLATGVVFFAASLPDSTIRPTIGVISGALLIALHAIARIGADTALDAMIAFTGGIIVWGWGEAMFLLCLVNGPNRTSCPGGAAGLHRFVLATRTVIHHEILLIVLAVLIAVLSGPENSAIALMTYLTLWILRLSAKFNLYLGTSNFSEDIAPHRLRYLATYFRRARMNALFPLSIIGGLALAVFYGMLASSAATSGHDHAGYTLLCTLTLLGVFEHGMMMIPLRDGALWTWLFGSRKRTGDWRARQTRTGETG